MNVRRDPVVSQWEQDGFARLRTHFAAVAAETLPSGMLYSMLDDDLFVNYLEECVRRMKAELP